MYVKNEQGDRLLVYITKEGVVIPKDEEASTEGYDLTEVYCSGDAVWSLYRMENPVSG